MQHALKMLAKLKAPITVVAHDAGAANHISAWLGTSIMSTVNGSFGGPAKDIFGRQCPWMSNAHFSELIPQCNTLISGTGWASAFEHDARKLAKQVGCHSIAVIDHWTNYRARFVRDGEEVLPDEIWVTDEYAKKMAEIEFNKLKVVQFPNLYLDSLVQEIRQLEYGGVARTGNNVLYALEPIRQEWGSDVMAGEFKGLDYFTNKLEMLKLGDDLVIRLRPHPSDPAGKYDQWINAQESVNICLDDSPTLAASIAWSDVVVGCQTYALVVALAAGKRVYSSIPPWAPPCILPQPGIIKIV